MLIYFKPVVSVNTADVLCHCFFLLYWKRRFAKLVFDVSESCLGKFQACMVSILSKNVES